MFIRTLAFVGLLWASAEVARADAPPYLPVQGYLTSSEGEAAEGPTKVRFRLYDRAEPTGSKDQILYEETQTVTVTAGVFSTYLGDNGKLTLELFRTHSIVFIGVLVADDDAELQPLLQLATAPYAAFANACGDSSTVGGKTVQEIVAAASAGSAPSTGGGGPGSAGPVGPAGAKGAKGDPGVLSVTATGLATAKLEGGALTIDVPHPFGWNQWGEAAVAASGISDVGWTTTPAPAGLVCLINLTAWFPGGAPTTASLLRLAVKSGDGPASHDFPELGLVPFMQIGNLSAAFQTSGKPSTFGCSIDNKSGATSVACRVSVLCS
ncbi:MAG: hypothetical protein RLZZ450_1755 [Pseudomonadota bacterium]|jgi:hypothetical protein